MSLWDLLFGPKRVKHDGNDGVLLANTIDDSQAEALQAERDQRVLRNRIDDLRNELRLIERTQGQAGGRT